MKLVVQIHTSNTAYVETTVEVTPVEVRQSVLSPRTFLRDKMYEAADKVIEDVLKNSEVWR